MSDAPTVEQIAAAQGLTVRTVVKEDYDHNVYEVERDGERLILKTVSKPELRAGLRREVAYTSLLAALSEADPGWTLRASAPVATALDWILKELVEGEPLLAIEGPYPERDLRRLGAALADLDRISPDPAARRPSYRNPAGEPVEDAEHRLREFERWVRTIAERGPLPGGPDRVLDRLREGRAAVQPGFEVWDAKLEEYVGVDDDKVALFDLEFAYLFGRRHYDVAKLYASLAVHGREEGVAGGLLGAYFEAHCHDREDLVGPLLPVLCGTLLAEAYGAAESEGDADDASQRDGCRARRERAVDLLGVALDGDMEALLRA